MHFHPRMKGRAVNTHFPPAQENAVLIEHHDGEWVVQVLENGEISERRFQVERHAESFADGQRTRLRLYSAE
jgi:hypothetical protein